MIAVDTNILAYAAGVTNHPDDQAKILYARSLFLTLRSERLIFPAQALGELFRLIARRNGPGIAADRVRLISADAFIAPTLVSTFDAALDLASRHRLQIWDAIIVSAAVDAGARWLLSEDMQAGFVWRGLTIVNPLTMDPATLLDRLRQ